MEIMAVSNKEESMEERPTSSKVSRQYRESTITMGDTSCSICLEMFTNPRFLPCLHTFCRDCIGGLRGGLITNDSSNTSVKCPKCRATHTVPPNGVDGFLPNTQIMREISEIKEATSEAKSTRRSCGMCPTVNESPVSYCSDCCEYLCNACHQSHTRMKIFQTHVTVSPDEANPSESACIVSYKCSEHPKEELKVYCIKCETVICRDCALYNHQGHTFKPAEEAAEEIKATVEASKRSAACKLTEFKNYAKVVKEHETHVSEFPPKLKQHISGTFDNSIKQLQLRKEKMLAEVNGMFETHSKSVWAQKDFVERTICSLEASINFTDRIIQSDNSLEQAVLGSRAIPQLKLVCKSSWKPSSIDSCYPMAFVPTISGSSAKTFQQQINAFGSLKNYGGNNGDKKPQPHLTIDTTGYSGQLQQKTYPISISDPFSFLDPIPQPRPQQGINISNLPRQAESRGRERYDTQVKIESDSSYVIKVTANPAPVDDSYPCFEIKAIVTQCSALAHFAAILNNSEEIETKIVKNRDKMRSWNVSFKTSKTGVYSIKIDLIVETKVIATKSKTILFK